MDQMEKCLHLVETLRPDLLQYVNGQLPHLVLARHHLGNVFQDVEVRECFFSIR